MKIGVLTYDDINHLKTEQVVLGLIGLKQYDLTIIYVPFLARKSRDVLIAHRPLQSKGMNTRELARVSNVCSMSLDHFYREKPFFDYLIVAGAGLLPDEMVTQYEIVNCHPGLIPMTRGLDSFKWAILNDQQVGCTLHAIDTNIDMGRLIHHEYTPLFEDDDIYSFAMRHYSNEIKMLINFEEKLSKIVEMSFPEYDPTRRMPKRIEQELLIHFEKNYKPKFSNTCVG